MYASIMRLDIGWKKSKLIHLKLTIHICTMVYIILCQNIHIKLASSSIQNGFMELPAIQPRCYKIQ